MNNSIEIIGIDHGWSQMKTSNYDADGENKKTAFGASGQIKRRRKE